MKLDDDELDEYRAWLLRHQSFTNAGSSTYRSDIKKLEEHIKVIDRSFYALTAEWVRDEFITLRNRLDEVRNKKDPPAALAKHYTDAKRTLSNWRRGLNSYEKVLRWTPPKRGDKDGVADVFRGAVNRILYGPPGVGKTFQTAAQAVALCGHVVPDCRRELMVLYRELMDRKRIVFVTFHQSTSYEEFVEGLRPVQRAGSESAGFELKAKDGIFREIAKAAEWGGAIPRSTTADGSVGREVTIGDDSEFYQMAIGPRTDLWSGSDLQKAVDGGYAVINGPPKDWSDDSYKEKDCIDAGWPEHGKSAADVRKVEQFRNAVNIGDFVVVRKDDKFFHAIGQFSGEYEFVRPEIAGGHCHRRAVDWLWVNADGAPHQQLYLDGKGLLFKEESICTMKFERLDTDRIEDYLNNRVAARPHVLIIDEINRANISKVFGELITLLEPDKRLGELNELTVQLPYSREKFGVPSNLHILGTMNTADRSIALLDTALRRRFTFQEIVPDPTQVSKDIGGINGRTLLDTINKRIEYLYDRDHRIGHAYFMNLNSRADLDAVMRERVIPLLAEYFVEDWSQVAAVLGDVHVPGGTTQGGFLNGTELADSTVKGNKDSPKIRWEVRSTEEPFVYGKELGGPS